MMKLKTALLAACALAALGCAPASASDLWESWSLNGGPTYCSSFVTPYAGNSYCQHQVPAGEAALTGTEVIPSDLGPIGVTSSAGGPQSGLFSILQLGNGAAVDLTTVATSQTIAAGVSWYYLDGAQGSAFTVTAPAAPVDGQLINVVCEAATVGTFTFTANSGQTVKLPVAAACVAGTGYQWRYLASNTTWYRTR